MGQRREPSFRVLLLLSCGTRVATPPSARQADLDVVGDTLPPLTRSTVCSAFHFSASDQSRRRREGDTDPSFLDLLAGRRHEHASALDPWEAAAARDGRNLRPGHITAGAMLRSRCSPKQLTSSLAAARRRRWGRAPAIDNPPCSLAASSVSRICRMTSLRG
jgi:hypothetical protein